MVNRRRFLTGAGALAAGMAGLGGYATAYEAGMRLDLTSYDLSSSHWPADLPIKIAVISDIHACEPWMPAERIGAIVDLANAQKPDLTVLLGDFVGTQHFVTRYVAPGAWAEQLARLEAPLGVYAVLGNHDWWSAAMPTDPPDNAQSVRKALAGAHIPVLENAAVSLSLKGRPFWLVGLGDQLAFRYGRRHAWGTDDLRGALREIKDDAPAILLAHEPFIFPKVPDRVALTLCGHTHGGQVNLPFIGAPFVPTKRGVKRYVYGLYQEGERQLIVSGGLGTSNLPVRFNRPPEVLSVALRGA
ncbi:metallophosphoesterase [Methylocapsa sp. S129]|uniref:metallophosphoesterase n=1 Tax=Methylocapsa sp. S129 TaxID=1641869 RepID=UPI00131DD968|nr:metallophosphoesterase [Methylocapsa sp. S129]